MDPSWVSWYTIQPRGIWCRRISGRTFWQRGVRAFRAHGFSRNDWRIFPFKKGASGQQNTSKHRVFFGFGLSLCPKPLVLAFFLGECNSFSCLFWAPESANPRVDLFPVNSSFLVGWKGFIAFYVWLFRPPHRTSYFSMSCPFLEVSPQDVLPVDPSWFRERGCLIWTGEGDDNMYIYISWL